MCFCVCVFVVCLSWIKRVGVLSQRFRVSGEAGDIDNAGFSLFNRQCRPNSCSAVSAPAACQHARGHERGAFEPDAYPDLGADMQEVEEAGEAWPREQVLREKARGAQVWPLPHPLLRERREKARGAQVLPTGWWGPCRPPGLH